MTGDFDAIPEELRERDQWICWKEEERDGNLTKIPKQPDGSGANAKSNDNATWGSFEEAVETARQNDDWGIGFVFSAEDPYVGIDLDGCIDTTREEPAPEDWLPSLDAFDNTYVERSPSGTGLHPIIKETSIPDWWTNQIKREEYEPEFLKSLDLAGDHDEVGVELYDSGRFFTFTGDTLPRLGGETVEPVPELYEWLTAAWLVFNDDVPGPEGEAKNGDVDFNVYDVLSRSSYPEGERREHPVHGSTTGANFMVDPGGETWRCWSGDHQVTGDAVHLVGMQEGLIKCAEWKHGEIDDDTWRSIFDACRERGLIDDESDDAPAPPPDEQSEDPDSDYIWDEIVEAYATAQDADDKQLARYRAARYLIKSRAFATREETDELYVYNPSRGIYENRGEPVIRRTLVEKLGRHYTRYENNETEAFVRGSTYKRGDEFGGPEWKIALQNCVLDLDEMEPEPHSPDHMFLSQMPVEYDEDAECPLWIEFLEDSIPKQIDRMKIQEYVGYTLAHWTLEHHKALFIVGPTASGKSTFLDTIRALLGRESVSSITPHELVDERFAAVELFGKWANIRNDISDELLENVGKFKELVAGDPIKAEEKYQPTFTFDPKAKHLYSANQLPDAAVDDDAFYRRIMLISFPRTVPVNERDRQLQSKLEEELPGILNWAIEGFLRLMDQEEFTGARSPAEVRTTWEKWGSSVERFKQECMVKESDAYVPKSVAHQAYLEYCEEEGLPSMSQNKMTRRLKMDSKISEGRKYVDNGQKRCYMGVRLGEEYEPDDGGDDDDDPPPDSNLDEFGME